MMEPTPMIENRKNEKAESPFANTSTALRKLADLRVRDLMTHEVVTLEKEQSLDLAREAMEMGHFRHVPVVNRGRLVGLLTHRDMLRSLALALAPFTQRENQWFGVTKVADAIDIGDAMTPDVTTVHPDTLVLQAATILKANKFGCLPVVEYGQLVGIVTEADFLTLAIGALTLVTAEPGGF